MAQTLFSAFDSSRLNRPRWERVRGEFLQKARSQLSPSEMAILENPDIEVARKQLDNLLTNHRPSAISKILLKLQPFLNTLDDFSKPFDVMSNASMWAAIAWGIFRIAMQMGNFALQRIGMVSDHLRNISKILDRLQRTEDQFSEQFNVCEVLEAAYSNILQFYLKVLRYLRKDCWWKRIFKRPIQGFDSLYGEIVRNLNENLAHLNSETYLASITVLNEGRHMPESQSIFLVPDGRHRGFIGRSTILRELKTHLDNSTGPDSTLRAVCLYGIGGVGKSMIAQEYVHTRRSKFHWVFWVTADTDQKLYTSFRSIARQLRVPDRYFNDKAEMISQVKARLSSATATWLIVFDNADDTNLIDEYWPLAGGKGSTILTTRDCFAPTRFDCHKISVGQLLIHEGVHFLKSIVERGHPSWLELDREGNAAISLVREVGALPIALSQAAATLNTGVSIEDLLVQYQDPTQSRLHLEADSAMLRTQRRVLGKTWDTSYEELKIRDHRGAYALQCLAWIDHDGMSKDVFRNVKFFPDDAMLFPTDANYQAAVQALARSSLVTSSTRGGILLVNRMVQVTTIFRMTRKEKIETFRSMAVLLESRFPKPYTDTGAIFPGIVKHSGECQRLISHVLSLVKNFKDYLLGEEIEKFGSLLQRAALYLLEIDNRQGGELLRMSLNMKWTCVGEEHVVPHIQMNLAWNHMRHGNLIEARSLGSKSLELFKYALGNEHALTAWAYCNHGRILTFNTEFEQARLHHQTAIDIYRRKLQTDPENNTLRFAFFMAQNYLVTAIHCQVRGDILGDIYEPSISSNESSTPVTILTEEVKDLLQQLLESCEKGLELSNQKYASVFPNKQTLAWVELTLCWILLDLERFDEAEKYNLLALAHVQDRFSPDGCGVGVTTVQRADILSAQGKTSEAEAKYHEAQSLLERKMGIDNPLTALTYHKIGNFYCRHRRFSDAVLSYKAALKSLEKSYGESHPTTATTMNNLGVTLINMGQREQGLRLLRRAFKTRREHFSSSHKLVMRLASNIDFLEAHPDQKFEETRILGSGELVSQIVHLECLSIDNVVNSENLAALALPHPTRG